MGLQSVRDAHGPSLKLRHIKSVYPSFATVNMSSTCVCAFMSVTAAVWMQSSPGKCTQCTFCSKTHILIYDLLCYKMSPWLLFHGQSQNERVVIVIDIELTEIAKVIRLSHQYESSICSTTILLSKTLLHCIKP